MHRLVWNISGRLAGVLAHRSVCLPAWAMDSPRESRQLCPVGCGLATTITRPMPGHVHGIGNVSSHASSRCQLPASYCVRSSLGRHPAVRGKPRRLQSDPAMHRFILRPANRSTRNQPLFLCLHAPVVRSYGSCSLPSPWRQHYCQG